MENQMPYRGACPTGAHPDADVPERVEAILRRYGVAERDIGQCCDDLSPHLLPPGAPRGRRYTEAIANDRP